MCMSAWLRSNAPTALRVRQAGQCVRESVQIGTDVQAHPLEIVSRIDDDGEILRGKNLDQAGQEFSRAYTACQRRN